MNSSFACNACWFPNLASLCELHFHCSLDCARRYGGRTRGAWMAALVPATCTRSLCAEQECVRGKGPFCCHPHTPEPGGDVRRLSGAVGGGGRDALVGISEPPFPQTFSRAYTLSRKHLNSFIPTCVQVPHALRRMKSIAFGDERANGLHFDRIAAGTPTPCDEEQAQNRSGKSGEVCNPQTGSIKVFLFFF